MRLLAGLLERFVRKGTLKVIDADGRLHVFGDGTGAPVTIRLHDRALHRQLFLRPDPVAGEAYMDGRLTIEEGGVYGFLELVSINRLRDLAPGLQSVLTGANRWTRRFQQYNPVGRARRNAQHHYDISNEFYRLFLDRDMQYSCGYFPTGTETLEEAQHRKKIHLGAKLLLKPGQRVLDIGSGWGGLALTLAQLEDVEVVGITLSTEQHALSNERARRLGLANRVRFELIDYREIRERFDRIVSVGMFEHVGALHYPAFFRQLRTLLTDDGVALLHSIGRHSEPGTTSPWLRRYIFPGGYAPAMSEVLAVVERLDLWVTDIEVLRLHYAETLRHWRQRFEANRERVAQMYDERFCRMWEFYLIGSEMSFRHGSSLVFQMQIAKDRQAVPQTRDYVLEAERRYLERAEPAGGLTEVA